MFDPSLPALLIGIGTGAIVSRLPKREMKTLSWQYPAYMAVAALVSIASVFIAGRIWPSILKDNLSEALTGACVAAEVLFVFCFWLRSDPRLRIDNYED